MKIHVIDPANHDPETETKKKLLDEQRDELFEEIKNDILAMVKNNAPEKSEDSIT